MSNQYNNATATHSSPKLSRTEPQGSQTLKMPVQSPTSPTSPLAPRYKPMRFSEVDFRMQEIRPKELEQLIKTDPSILIIDVRPWNMYSFSHISSAISICIPSTLMKRPTFGFDRILEFVSPQDVEKLRSHAQASHIIFYDQGTLRTGTESNLRRTAAKFLSASPSPENRLFWLVGGIYSVSCEAPDIIVHTSKNFEQNESLADELSDESSLSELSYTSSSGTTPPSHLRTAGSATPSKKVFRPPKLSLAAMRPLPFSPNSPFPVSFGPSTPVLDQSSRIEIDKKIEKRVDDLPKWLYNVIDQTSNGKNVLAEGFCQLESDEKMRKMCKLTDPRPSPGKNESPSCRKEYSYKQMQYMQQRSSGNTLKVAPPTQIHATPLTPSTPAPNLGSTENTDYSLVTGDDPRKNRYTNIAPYSHNAVKVKSNAYFNGSFITSSYSSFRYIATQAPTPSAFGDFWHCVWEQRVPLIVMLTTLLSDSGQVKGNKYWFDSTYDGLQVELLSESELKDADSGTVLRNVRLTMASTGEQRTVVQMQYLNWPDLGCPTNPSEALKLTRIKRRLMNELEMSKNSFVIVHCSAGCGRTGTFCTIDTVTDFVDTHQSDAQNSERDIIMDVVSQFRQQRIAMVQNQLQLQLCYQAVMLWCYEKLEQQKQ